MSNNLELVNGPIHYGGADKPYEKLKKALKADINESAWDVLY